MDKAVLLSLADRCEAASGPDRELDNAIADACGLRSPSDPAGWPPCYTAGLDCALSLVPEGLWWSVDNSSAAYLCDLNDAGKRYRSHADCESPALSVCAAALRARTALA